MPRWWCETERSVQPSSVGWRLGRSDTEHTIHFRMETARLTEQSRACPPARSFRFRDTASPDRNSEGHQNCLQLRQVTLELFTVAGESKIGSSNTAPSVKLVHNFRAARCCLLVVYDQGRRREFDVVNDLA